MRTLLAATLLLVLAACGDPAPLPQAGNVIDPCENSAHPASCERQAAHNGGVAQ